MQVFEVGITTGSDHESFDPWIRFTGQYKITFKEVQTPWRDFLKITHAENTSKIEFDLGYGSLVSIKPLLWKLRHRDEIFWKITHAENVSKIEFELGYGSLVRIKPLLRKFRHRDEIFLKITHAENVSKIEFELGYGSLVSIKPLLRKFRHRDEIFF